jgi:hypothetical protein
MPKGSLNLYSILFPVLCPVQQVTGSTEHESSALAQTFTYACATSFIRDKVQYN